MQKFLIITILVLIFLLLIGGIYYSNENSNLKNKLKVFIIDNIDTVKTNPILQNIDSAKVSKKDGVLVPKIIYRDTGSFKQVPFIVYDTIKELDTIYVLKDYFSLKYYQDSINIQDVDIKVLDTLQKNSIFARQYIIKNNRTEDFYKRRMLYIGGTTGTNFESFYIGPTVTYIDKKNNLFGGRVLFDGSPNNTYLFDYAKKITFKK